MKAAIITRDVLPLFRDLIESDAYEEIRENKNSVAIGLREKNTAVGALTGMVDELDIFTVTSLYVLPSFRRHQGGTMLMYALTTLLESLGRGVALMSYVEGTGDFEMLPSFLESIGAYETDSLEKLYIGTVGALYEQFAFTKELGNSGVISFNDLAPGQQLQLTENNHVGDLRTLGGGLSGLVPSPFLSFARVVNGRLKGVLIGGETDWGGEKALVLTFTEGNQRDKAVLAVTFIHACHDMYPPGKRILIPSPDGSLDMLLRDAGDLRNIQHNYVL